MELTSNDKTKITEYCDAGVSMLQQIKDLQDSLKDMTKNLADELDVKPAQLKKLVVVAFKANLAEQRDDLEAIETLLAAAGR